MKSTRVLQLALLALLVVVAFVPARAEEGGEHVEHQHQDPPPEDPVPPQQEETPPVHEETPPVEEQAAPVEEEAPPVEQEAPPVEQETPPVVEETPPPQEEVPPIENDASPPPRDESPPPTDDSLFDINVYECQAPEGDPLPERTTPLQGKMPVVTLCFRPKNMDGGAELKAITMMDFNAVNGPSQAAVADNAAAGPMTRTICPMGNDPALCIAATKLNEDFFAKSYTKVSAKGEIVIAAAGEERTVPFEYQFGTAEAPKQQPVEHDYFEMPTTPPPFPCGREIRIWLLSALILTLLEFAFSPDSESLMSKATTGGDESAGAKKKKSKKE